MDFKTYLQTTSTEIDQALDKIFADWTAQTEQISSALSPIIKLFEDSSQGGKRLRGTLVKLGYELSGGTLNPEIAKAATAFEIFQTAILAHDDVIDKSQVRRGKPSIFTALGGDHYAISQTLSLGDIGFFFAMNLIAETGFSDKLKTSALADFSKTMLETSTGQLLDLELTHQNQGRSEEEVLHIYQLKTGQYTFSGPLKLGAILGGGEVALQESLSKFGESLGVAFQIHDDILGMFSDELTLGKSVVSDVEEGKLTLLYAYALKHGTAVQVEILERWYGKGEITHNNLEEIRQIFRESGALEYSQNKSYQYADQAKNIAFSIKTAPEKTKLLSELVDFLIHREP